MISLFIPSEADVVLQIAGKSSDLTSLDYYLKKTFFKTASLMANSCKAIALLAGQTQKTSEEAWNYGRHVGLAFQVKPAFNVSGNRQVVARHPFGSHAF